MRKLIILLLLVLAVGGGLYYVNRLRADTPPSFRTATVTRGDLLITIGATGTVEPEEIVDVGAQVVGRIKELGVDPRSATDPAFKDKRIDFGSPVEKDTVLAQIDPALYEATYQQAKAGVLRAKADLEQSKAKYVQSTAEWNRAQRLRELKLTAISGLGTADSPNGQKTIKGISDSDFVLAKANYEVSKANVDVSEALVKTQEALLFSAKTNLDYTTIISPVRGTIIARRVNIGQTVVSSFNAPSLFLIAKNLKRMEVWANVNEADIGQIKEGMNAHFTVDAFRDDVFKGVVRQIRLNAQETNHVITFTVVITVNNDDLKLLPYLSAELKFELDERRDVLKVPNAAFRYRPRPELIMPPPPGAAKSQPSEGDDPEKTRTVWIRQGNFVYPLDIQIGITDNMETEVVRGPLTDQMELVLAENIAGTPPAEGTNPFAPPRFRGTKKNNKKTP